MKGILKQIPTTMTKPLSPRKKVHKLMKEIGGGWCMKKITLGLLTLRRPKLSKNNTIMRMKLKNYKNLIGIGMIENSKYIGTSLNGSIQEVKSKGKTLFNFFN